MQKIGALFARDLSRRIPIITRLDDSDENDVLSEIADYVFTDAIKHHYRTILTAIADDCCEPHAHLSVLISGPPCVGRTSFAKHLGHALVDPIMKGTRFSEVFSKPAQDTEIGDLLKCISSRYPFEVIFIDVPSEADAKHPGERISHLIYRVLRRRLGYADDFYIAELELALEDARRLEEFTAKCREIYRTDWVAVRKSVTRVNRASALLHALDPTSYPTADTWAHSQRTAEETTSAPDIVERIFQLADRRCPGKALVIILDGVDLFITRSVKEVRDLHATLEALLSWRQRHRKQGTSRVPSWVVLISNSDLPGLTADPLGAAWANLQDRFTWRLHFTYSGLREAVYKRLLAKNTEATTLLRRMFSEHESLVVSALQLDAAFPTAPIDENSFVSCYPLPPHYFDICIRMFHDIELPNLALYGHRHYISSFRFFHDILVGQLADKPLGSLVTFANVFDAVSCRLSAVQRESISDIDKQLGADPNALWCRSVAKVICLLEFLPGIPSTPKNIAAFLLDRVGKWPPLSEVRDALFRLSSAGVVWDDAGQWRFWKCGPTLDSR